MTNTKSETSETNTARAAWDCYWAVSQTWKRRELSYYYNTNMPDFPYIHNIVSREKGSALVAKASQYSDVKCSGYPSHILQYTPSQWVLQQPQRYDSQ